MRQNPVYEPDYDYTTTSHHYPREGPSRYNDPSQRSRDTREGSPLRRDGVSHMSKDSRDDPPRSRDYREYPSRSSDWDRRCDPYAHREYMHSRPMYDTRDNPYSEYGGGMHPPMHGTWGYSQDLPWYRYDGYMQRDPYYMHDSMENLMYPPRPPPRRGFYQDYRKRRNPYDDGYGYGPGQRVGFNEDVEEVEPEPPDPEIVAQVYRQKRKTRLGILVIMLILLVATIVMGFVATLKEPWWIQKTTIGTTTFTAVKVGLWETCYKAKESDTYACHKYSEGEKYKSPYKSIKLLQWSMIVGIAVAFIAILFTFFAILGRKTRFFPALLYTIIGFTIASTALFGFVVAYVNDDKQATKLVGKWIKLSETNLVTSTMFYITCAVTACNVMSLILAAILAFINEPEPTKIEEEIVVHNKKIESAKKKHKKNNSSNKKERNSSEDQEKRGRTPTKIVKDPPFQNGHVSNTPHYREPVAIIKDKENPTEVRKNVYEQRRPPPSIGVPPKDYTEKKDHKDGKNGYTNLPKQNHPYVIPNRPPAPPPPKQQIPQTRFPQKPKPTVIPHERQHGGIQPQDSRRLGLELYGGDYDKYLNEPY